MEAIYAAMGIGVSDLYDHDNLKPDGLRKVQVLRENEMARERHQRRRRIALMKGYRACSRRMEDIARLHLAGGCLDEEALNREFHDALEFQRRVEKEIVE